MSESRAEPDPIQSALPLCCPGCGAFSQTVDPNEAGYYSKTRKQTRKRLAEMNRAEDGDGGGEGEVAEEGQKESAKLETKGENLTRDIQQLMAAEKENEEKGGGKKATEEKEDGKKAPQPSSTWETVLTRLWVYANSSVKNKGCLPPQQSILSRRPPLSRSATGVTT
jgi:hypothetical protein